MSFSIRCHRCSHWMGEARVPMELEGMFKAPRDVESLPAPRDTWRCKSCGWANVFRPADEDWRAVEAKQGAGAT